MCQILSTMLKEAFVKAEDRATNSSSLGTSAGQVDGLPRSALLCICLFSRVYCEDETGWSHLRNPNLPALSACQLPPSPWEGFHCPGSPPPFKSDALNATLIKEKVIKCPFVLAAASKEQNKYMVMKPYRVCFRCWLSCGFAFQWCSSVQPRFPATRWRVQPADRDPAHSNGLMLHHSPQHRSFEYCLKAGLLNCSVSLWFFWVTEI